MILFALIFALYNNMFSAFANNFCSDMFIIAPSNVIIEYPSWCFDNNISEPDLLLRFNFIKSKYLIGKP